IVSPHALRSTLLPYTTLFRSELSSLRATDKIQRDIEHILLNKDWFYDRRKNFYKNQGKPADRIVSLSFMYTAVYALCLKNLPLRSEEHTSELQSRENLVCRLL